ncbi:MAG: hypothetical protein HDS13_07300 [Bacteroides sp.]|nr:hypothetical protein [Bacteroides sp.]
MQSRTPAEEGFMTAEWSMTAFRERLPGKSMRVWSPRRQTAGEALTKLRTPRVARYDGRRWRP